MEYIYFYCFIFLVLDLFSLYSADVYFYSTLCDVFIVLSLYFFSKLLLLCSLVELIWPTQFFNRRCLNTVTFFRLRGYTEYLLKLFCPDMHIATKTIQLSF